MAQSNTISGVVINDETKKEIPGVNVFLDRTTIGTTTDKSGKYHLNSLPDGTYDLIFSFVGFKQIRKKISFPRSYNSPINVLLKPNSIVMDSLIVKGKRPDEWLENFRKFKRRFLGYSRNAGKTTIINPEILNFDTRDGNFIAYSEEPVVLKNEALGYKIILYLQHFSIDGIYLRTETASRFSLMEPENKAERQRWQRERKRAYKGSFRHFIHSMVDGRLNEEEFRLLFTEERKVYPGSNERPNRSLVNFGRYDEVRVKDITDFWNYRRLGQIKLSLKDGYKYIKAVYLKEHPERSIAMMLGIDPALSQVSFIEFPQGSAIIDVKSALSIPPDVPVTYGYWAWSSSIPEWLPKDYEPNSIK